MTPHQRLKALSATGEPLGAPTLEDVCNVVWLLNALREQDAASRALAVGPKRSDNPAQWVLNLQRMTRATDHVRRCYTVLCVEPRDPKPAPVLGVGIVSPFANTVWARLSHAVAVAVGRIPSLRTW